MKIYFVRHGESVGNAAGVHQTGDMELSDIGLMQARNLAQRFKDIRFDVLLASDFMRAKQTAEAIGDVVGKKVKFDVRLREYKKPTEIEGKRVDSPEAVKIKEQMANNRLDPKWHFSDEENIFELIVRARDFVASLEKLKGEVLVIVTHGTLLRTLIGVLTLGEDFEVADWVKLRKVLWWLDNTGISVVEKIEGKWMLKNWNDSAHLG